MSHNDPTLIADDSWLGFTRGDEAEGRRFLEEIAAERGINPDALDLRPSGDDDWVVYAR